LVRFGHFSHRRFTGSIFSGVEELLTAAGVGFAAEAVVARYFLLQYWCGAIALAHLLAEYFYCGRPVRRMNLIAGAGNVGLGAGGRIVGAAENAHPARGQILWQDGAPTNSGRLRTSPYGTAASEIGQCVLVMGGLIALPLARQQPFRKPRVWRV
jgi:hypothetical protein